MPLLDLRDLLAFPNGDNQTDTVINNIHFNKTALQHWNYTFYSNGTLSNYSKCYLVFDEYKPVILSNGTFVNGTSCYVPILPIKTRGILGVVFASLFAIGLFFTLISLKKHGQRFLREDRRFRIVGRRWLWYWLIIMCACGIISCVTGVDVDRNYLQDLALILQSFFFVLTGVTSVCAVWEAVRHWGSWLERQMVDRDPHALPPDDARGTIEFYMPLVFYLFSFMSFFLTVPRSWSRINKQRSPEQQETVARPSALDPRFKAGHLFLVLSLFVIIYCVRHTIHYYKPSQRGALARLHTYIRSTPIKFLLAIVIVAIRIGYGVAMTFVWDISLLKFDGEPVWPFVFGYTPCVLLLIVFNFWGLLEENEDKILIQQRIERGRLADEEMNLTYKPSWWSKIRGEAHLDDLQRLRRMVADHNISSNDADNDRSSRGFASRLSRGPQSGMPTPDLELHAMGTVSTPGHQSAVSETFAPYHDSRNSSSPGSDSIDSRDGHLSPSNLRTPPLRSASSQSINTLGSAFTGRTLTSENAQPQTVRSMLDL